jgi:hypothetical protein
MRIRWRRWRWRSEIWKYNHFLKTVLRGFWRFYLSVLRLFLDLLFIYVMLSCWLDSPLIHFIVYNVFYFLLGKKNNFFCFWGKVKRIILLITTYYLFIQCNIAIFYSIWLLVIFVILSINKKNVI